VHWKTNGEIWPAVFLVTSAIRPNDKIAPGLRYQFQDATGTPFKAIDDAGRSYHGHLVTHRARRMMRNGSMLLVFDEEVKPVTKDREGAFRAANKVPLLKLGGSLALAKLADDSVDETIGASKARYVGAAAAIGVLLFTKGEEAKLHARDTIQVYPGR
jgi:hypothetical protein